MAHCFLHRFDTKRCLLYPQALKVQKVGNATARFKQQMAPKGFSFCDLIQRPIEIHVIIYKLYTIFPDLKVYHFTTCELIASKYSQVQIKKHILVGYLWTRLDTTTLEKQ